MTSIKLWDYLSITNLFKLDYSYSFMYTALTTFHAQRYAVALQQPSLLWKSVLYSLNKPTSQEISSEIRLQNNLVYGEWKVKPLQATWRNNSVVCCMNEVTVRWARLVLISRNIKWWLCDCYFYQVCFVSNYFVTVKVSVTDWTQWK